jgi:pyruvate dehydrogenase E2 component (dihydrolipoamide acetyltransferase)
MKSVDNGDASGEAKPAAEQKPEPQQPSAPAAQTSALNQQPARQKQQQAAPSSPAASPASPSGQSQSPTAHISDENIRKAHASPGVRRYAREHGADLSLISGTGPKGRISKQDVVAFIKQAMEGMGSNYGSAAASLAGGGAGIPQIPEVDFSRFGEIERVELGRINKLSAANLHRAWLNLPMVTHHELADVTEMEAFRKQLKAESKEGDPKVTGLAFHMKALVKSLQAYPKLNSSLSADGEALFYKRYFHIGIAVDTPNGLVVPVFRDVDKKSINQLADEMSDMSARARQKKLKPDEMQGASMTISSLGGIGGTAFTPIVNPPEVAILGITRATMQPVWNGSEFVPRLMCPLDLTYDHRVIDGADAARFMAYYVKQISDIRRLTL